MSSPLPIGSDLFLFLHHTVKAHCVAQLKQCFVERACYFLEPQSLTKPNTPAAAATRPEIRTAVASRERLSHTPPRVDNTQGTVSRNLRNRLEAAF